MSSDPVHADPAVSRLLAYVQHKPDCGMCSACGLKPDADGFLWHLFYPDKCDGFPGVLASCTCGLDDLLAAPSQPPERASVGTQFTSGTVMPKVDLVAAPAAVAWQPIETAPKDGTEILTYRGVGLIAVAAYFPHGEAEWCVTDGMHILNVTHWMPLPAAPAEPEG